MIRIRSTFRLLVSASMILSLGACASADKAAPGAENGSSKDSLNVVMLSGSIEYKSDKSLAILKDFLEKHYENLDITILRRAARDKLPGLEALEKADLAVVFTRRMTMDGKDLERIKTYCTGGNPIVGIRTASHAFQKWLAFDKEVLGGNYHDHFSNKITCQVEVVPEEKGHPILKGFEPFVSKGSLYKNGGHAKDINILLTASIPGHTEPVAWTRTYKGARIFYTSLGHMEDFKNEGFLRMLANAIFWTTKTEPVKR